ncbi:hypothetical protein Desku_0754 [Desulfofundulus kuznetsovii DSM 6115]|uniref:Uncharacterized protein n=1 Tax=Desulfofundulus kuznetsovii (strain DSM 6115 / VKM B-1805 / 17) TaxID=760568 RepID=A0AAU8PAW3_DESK7|nr:hypothetical protein Desku_0754 [Desulfofundulus kuznetsovii DSM 6115]
MDEKEISRYIELHKNKDVRVIGYPDDKVSHRRIIEFGSIPEEIKKKNGLRPGMVVNGALLAESVPEGESVK